MSSEIKHATIGNMKYFIVLSLTLLAGCSPQSKADFIRSQNVYPFEYILPEELIQRLYSNPHYYILIDTRPSEQFQKARIPNAVNYPYPSSKKELQEYLISLPTNSAVLFYGETGKASLSLNRFISSQKLPSFFLAQGFQMWIGVIEGADAENQKIENKRRYDNYQL